MNIFVRYYNYLKKRKEHRKVIKQLNSLSDKELQDIGINRGDINRLIWNEEDRNNRG